VPAVTAISPGLSTLSDSALFGWSAAIADRCAGLQAELAGGFAVNSPCTENVGTVSATRFDEIP